MEEQKVALVTGSSSGIGLACVKLLAQKGYQVVIVGSNKDKVEAAAQECSQVSSSSKQINSNNNKECLKLVLDFSNPDNGIKAVEETIKHYGRLDALINNAGIFLKTPATDKSSYEAYRNAMTINTDATVKCTLAAVEHLKKTNGNIIFMSSVASMKPFESGYAYCMSKAAMSAFARCLAIDLAPNIRVNIVSPGPVLTPIFRWVGLNEQQSEAVFGQTTLLNRMGHVEEIASAVAYLISDEASFVNGHEMVIDGGFTIKDNLAASIRARQSPQG